ncbi:MULTISPECIES: TRAP transporter small permease [unclassified Halomonas]|uniref:TRAP transporter small permease n=1 Tax=unclassified Halomonas TaxID=2609666 RepID=UPI001C983DEA|nr:MULTISPECIES: TRAP transporter small permease [unclassified Halomonas]MBY5926830.1 TRAP transporter small permease subunit [Halomonas sp. DP4Y7-2]MBY5985892.1 TRAP transporter small permease subunit [Halomonas sp. DP5Y7-2]MBY6233872.1 TRAP transporter small permease subunit [Halomonas sp. DP4Y7-1]
MSQRLDTALDRLALGCALAGGSIILVQALWMSWGVFSRYVLNSPDRMVTEATALLLFPVAFAGLGYAMRRDAYPKVTMLLDILPGTVRRWVQAFNLVVMALIGLWFMYVSFSATMNTLASGAASEILLWPRVYFWIPVLFAMVTFCCCVLHRLLQQISGDEVVANTKQGIR